MSEIRADGWGSHATGLGTLGDRAAHTQFFATPALSDGLLEDLFIDDDFAERIVSALPDLALREGYRIPGDEEGSILKAAEVWNISEQIGDAWKWARLFGGSVMVMGILDGPPDQAVDLDNIRPGALAFLDVFDRRHVSVETRVDDPSSPNHGQPELYRISAAGANVSTGSLIHHTRVIRWPGAKAPRSTRSLRSREGWDHSVLQRPYPVLQDVNSDWRAATAAMQDLSVMVQKIKGYQAKRAGIAATRTRLSLNNITRSVGRTVVIDAEQEDFEAVGAVNLQAVPPVLMQAWQRLAAAARMPVTELLGMSPAGLNATGESDTRSWYAKGRNVQTLVLRPRLVRLIKVIAQSADLVRRGARSANTSDERLHIDDIGVEFNSLWQRTAEEEASYRKTVLEGHKILVDTQAVHPEQVAISTWGSGRFSPDLQIDGELLEALQAAERAEIEERLADDPPEGGDPPAEPTDLPGPAEPTEPPQPAQAPPPEPARAALNGAQIAGFVGVVQAVVEARIPRRSAAVILSAGYPSLTAAEIAEALADVGEGFDPDEPAASALPAAVPPVPTGSDDPDDDPDIPDPDDDPVT